MNKILKTTRSLTLIGLLPVTLVLSGCVSMQFSDDKHDDSSKLFELLARADLAYDENRWLDATRDYQSLAQRVPQDSYAWFRLGNTFAKQGKLDQAIEAYRSSIARDAQQPKSWYNLATAHLLNAQNSLFETHNRLRADDPAKLLIQRQLASLDKLIFHRLEEVVSPEQGLVRR